MSRDTDAVDRTSYVGLASSELGVGEGVGVGGIGPCTIGCTGVGEGTGIDTATGVLVLAAD